MRTPLAVLSRASLAVVAALALGGDPAGPADVKIPTKRGAELEATVHRPAKGNGVAVVLAPGAGYHRGLPLMKRSAEALAEAGFVAVRFDWAYFTAKGQPQDDLAPEVADLDAAVAFARKQEGVTKVIVAGKSLGSMVTIRWGKTHKDDAAAFAL